MAQVLDQSGKVFVVTGANAGIGRVTALELARAGGRVVLACRSRERTQEVLDAIWRECGEDRAVFVALDLSDLESVRGAAAEVLALGWKLDVLVNNAGLAGQRGLTKQGFELAFGVNHLGHFLWTMLLYEALEGEGRVVHVASRAHHRVKKAFDWEGVKREARTVTAFEEYSASKLANVWFSAELARRAAGSGVESYALHPGVVASEIWREVPGVVRWVMKRFMVSNEEGAQTTLHCATSAQVCGESGSYYDRSAVARASRLGRDEGLARELWERSVAWTAASVPQVLQGGG